MRRGDEASVCRDRDNEFRSSITFEEFLKLGARCIPKRKQIGGDFRQCVGHVAARRFSANRVQQRDEQPIGPMTGIDRTASPS